MRILNVTQSYFPFFEFGGPPVKVRALSKALSRRGHRVTVLTADWGFQTRFPSQSLESSERTSFGWKYEEEGIEAIYLPMWLRYRALSWNPRVRRFCRERLREFDVAHIFGLYDFLGATVAAECRRMAIPYVVEPIGMFLPIVRNIWLKRMYHLLLGKRLVGQSRIVVATSEQEVAELVSGGVPAEKIALRRNGVEAPEALGEAGSFRRAHGIPDNAKLVLFLGRLSQKKSPDLLLEAFAIIRERVESEKGAVLRLALVGPDEEGMGKRLRLRAEELGVGALVKFCGPVFGKEKWDAYRDANVFVLPSQNENFGNTAGEAAASGTPVIVTEKCGIAPFIANGAGLIVPLDRLSLAEAIQKVLFEPGLGERLSAGCREIVSRLTWDEPAREMETMYRRIAIGENAIASCMQA